MFKRAYVHVMYRSGLKNEVASKCKMQVLDHKLKMRLPLHIKVANFT